MAFPASTTRTNLIGYVRRNLGEPTLKVELDDSQINDAIDDAMILYQEWSGDGTHFGIYVFDGVKNTSQYALPSNIQEVTKAATVSFSRALTTNIIDPYLNIFGPANEGYSLVEIGTEYLSDVQRMFETIRAFSTWRDVTGILQIEFTPPPRVTEKIGLEVRQYIDENQLLSTIWIRQYVLARSKLILGETREKYAQLAGPNGPQLNGAALKSEAQIEIDKLKDNLMTQHMRPIAFIVG